MYKSSPGRMNMPKTGRDIPNQFKNPLYITGDPTKKKAAEKEAKAKADKSAASAERVYGKSTTKTERFKDDRGTGTRTTVTTPYTKSGTGSAEFNIAYGAAKKAGKKTFDYGGKLIKVEDAASKSGKDVRSTVKYDKVKGLGLKPEGIKINTTGPKAKINIGRLKEQVDPIERIEVIQQTGGPQGYMGYGRQTIRRVDGGAAEVAAQAIRQAPYKETTVVRGIRRSGKTKDIFSKGVDKSKYGLSGKFIYGEKTGAEQILERRAKLAEQKKQRLAKK